MKKTFVSILFILLFTISYSFGAKAAEDTALVRKAVDEANLKSIESWKKADATAYAALFAEDATIMTINHSNVKGRQNIEQLRAQTIKTVALKDGKLTTEELQVSGDLAYEIGAYSYTLQVPGKQPYTIGGRNLIIWKKQKDGSWKIQVHASLPDLPK